MLNHIFEMARASGATDELGERSIDIFCFTRSELQDFTTRLTSFIISQEKNMGIINGASTTVEYKVTLDQLKKLIAKDLCVPESSVTMTPKMVTKSDIMERSSWQEFSGLTVTVTNSPAGEISDWQR